MIKIKTEKEFELIDEVPDKIAMSMNHGDIFLPKGTEWEYIVLQKVYSLDNNNKEYTFFVSVRKFKTYYEKLLEFFDKSKIKYI